LINLYQNFILINSTKAPSEKPVVKIEGNAFKLVPKK
jgi:hypothetical protein